MKYESWYISNLFINLDSNNFQQNNWKEVFQQMIHARLNILIYVPNRLFNR